MDNINKIGSAEVIVTKVNYDESVLVAKDYASENNYEFVQDTAFENYIEIPNWICQGYTCLIDEATREMSSQPTHVFLQVGVGSFAMAITSYLMNKFTQNPPVVVTVEPMEAACIY